MGSPSQGFSYSVIWTGDESSRVCSRHVRLGCHGERSQSNSPQQLEHKHTQERRLKYPNTHSQE